MREKDPFSLLRSVVVYETDRKRADDAHFLLLPEDILGFNACEVLFAVCRQCLRHPNTCSGRKPKRTKARSFWSSGTLLKTIHVSPFHFEHRKHFHVIYLVTVASRDELSLPLTDVLGISMKAI